jgi:hypothetical protein
MRTVPVTLLGQTYDMPASFAASREIAQKVVDPLQLSRDAAGSLTVEQVVHIIAIGVKFATDGQTRHKLEDIGEHIVQEGVIKYLKVAVDYVIAFLGDGSEGKKD